MNWQDAQKISNAAFLQAMSACAVVKALGMHAENQQRISNGHSIAYDDAAFAAVIDEFGIGHNAAIETLRNGL